MILYRRSTNSTQSRADHYGKGRFTTQEVEGWQKKPSTTESPTVVSAVHLETSNIHMHDHHRSTEATENSGSLPHGKLEEQSVLPMSDLSDNPAQVYKLICASRIYSTSEIYMGFFGGCLPAS